MIVTLSTLDIKDGSFVHKKKQKIFSDMKEMCHKVIRDLTRSSFGARLSSFISDSTIDLDKVSPFMAAILSGPMLR